MINGAKRICELLAQPGSRLCSGTFDCVSAKVAAACEARRSPDFAIIARTEALAIHRKEIPNG